MNHVHLSAVTDEFKKKIPRDEVASYIAFYTITAKLFSEKVLQDSDIALRVSKPKLNDFVVSMTYDIARFIDFHDTPDGIDKYKRAAYQTRWLTKIKPISAVGAPSTTSESLAASLLNELYAVFVAEVVLDQKFPKDFVKRLLYELYYRDCSFGQLNLTFETIGKVYE